MFVFVVWYVVFLPQYWNILYLYVFWFRARSFDHLFSLSWLVLAVSFHLRPGGVFNTPPPGKAYQRPKYMNVRTWKGAIKYHIRHSIQSDSRYHEGSSTPALVFRVVQLKLLKAQSSKFFVTWWLWVRAHTRGVCWICSPGRLEVRWLERLERLERRVREVREVWRGEVQV